MRLILRLFCGAVLFALAGCAPRADVELAAPDLALDTINPALVSLESHLAEHPRAQTIRLSWRIVPNPNRPLEALPRWFVYNRAQKTLSFHHGAPFYDVYSGVTDAILTRIAAKKGGVRMLLKNGCPRTFAKEN